MQHFFPDYGYGLHRLVYVSRSLMGQGPAAEAEIAALIAAAAKNNRSLAITGALLAYEGWFVQTLEGERGALKPLFEAIAADPRHTAVVLKSVEPAPRRLFARWGMKQGSAAGPMVFDIGAAGAEDLLSLLKLSTLTPQARVAA